MVTLPQILDVSSPPQRPLPAKEIFWPTAIGYGDQPESGDSKTFPNVAAIKARKGAVKAEPLKAFAKAACEAQDRVLILDEYLFKPEESVHQEHNSVRQGRIQEVINWFPADFSGSDVRLLTASIGDIETETDIARQFEELATSINNARAYPGKLQILVKFTLGTEFPYIHDRFAVIDSELWHFGATVGGFHREVNAATRGWSAADHKAFEFFDLAWRGDRDQSRNHDKSRSKR